MNRGVIAFIIIIIIGIAFFAYTYFSKGGVAPPTTHTLPPKNTVANIPLNSIINNTTNTNNTKNNTKIFGSCFSSNIIVPIQNGNFGTGTFAGWNATGYGFGAAPVNITYANANHQYYNSTWSNYNGIFFASTGRGGLTRQTGNLTSLPFKVNEPYLNFRVISPQNELLYIEILESGVPRIIVHYNTYSLFQQSTFANASVPLVNVLCQNVSVRVVSGVVGATGNFYQFIAAGDFYMSQSPVQTPGILVNITFSNS